VPSSPVEDAGALGDAADGARELGNRRRRRGRGDAAHGAPHAIQGDARDGRHPARPTPQSDGARVASAAQPTLPRHTLRRRTPTADGHAAVPLTS